MLYDCDIFFVSSLTVSFLHSSMGAHFFLLKYTHFQMEDKNNLTEMLHLKVYQFLLRRRLGNKSDSSFYHATTHMFS